MAWIDGPWDGSFKSFQLLNEFVEKFAPNIRYFTAEQADLVHEYADKIAQALLEGNYAYTPKEVRIALHAGNPTKEQIELIDQHQELTEKRQREAQALLLTRCGSSKYTDELCHCPTEFAADRGDAGTHCPLCGGTF